MSPKSFPLHYSSKKEQENVEWANANLKPWAKPLNDQRVQTNGTSGSPGSSPFAGPLEGIRAFIKRNTE